ncbi:MAG TPA: nucleoside kinase [Anaerolineaceae bacterium]|nr:nucleoside kinase [Anaerolineaceae bacterium]
MDFYLTNKPRESVELTLSDGRIITGKRGGKLEDFVWAVQKPEEPLIVGAILDGHLRELTYPVKQDGQATLLSMEDSDGARIYRRSLVFLLEVAFRSCFPEGGLTIDHSVSSGGYYCQVSNLKGFGQEELDRIKAAMQVLVDQDVPFVRETVPLEEAIAYFKAAGKDDKVRLLKYRKRKDLVLYRAGETRDYHHGYMVPSSGYLKWFDLYLLDDAFIIRFPRRHAPSEVLPMDNYPTLLKTFKDYGDWLTTLGIHSVGALNDAIQEGHIDEVILVSEALHEMQIAEIAAQIYEARDRVGVILIAGPSSSGKTTFSKRLGIQLLAKGITPFALEMDNFFIDREKTPLDANGHRDYESLRALDLARLNSDLKALIAGQEVELPRYDFITGFSVDGAKVQLNKGDVIILEGIHGLNPELLTDIDPKTTFRIYVSCLTQLNLDRYNRISTTDTRLLRRMVRDARERGYTAKQTIERWESVRLGEQRHIFPYQDNADEIFNSALAYDLSALRALAEPLLRQVPFNTPENIEAKRLLAFLEWFLPLDEDLIPDNSILREFLGNSILSDFSLW